jgi:site-specific recombinase XerD
MMMLSQAIEGYYLHAEARGLSDYTVKDYRQTFEKFLRFQRDTPVDQVTKADIERFMASLNGAGKKTRLNHHTGLSALWTWMVEEELVEVHVVRQVKAPKPETPLIKPLSEKDVKLLLASVEYSRPYMRHFQYEPCMNRNPNWLRNKAIIFLLLDTGVRATELCSLAIQDFDLRNKEIEVQAQGAKGNKGRIIPVTAKTAKLLWRYLATRSEADKTEPLFASKSTGLSLTRDGLGIMLRRLGKKAGVEGVHPHRFRHTFAINYLRNGGDAFTLQRILGHSDMAMTRRYLQIAREDLAIRHHSASPVANWGI